MTPLRRTVPALVAGITSWPEPERIPEAVSVKVDAAERPPTLLTVMARALVTVAVALSAPPFKVTALLPPRLASAE